jgi:endonuclease/exonuclease/phosphatase family metal-dependent hydrolase
MDQTLSSNNKLSVVSFNVQSLPTVFGLIPLSKNNKLRTKKLIKILKENFKNKASGYDLIFLQEIWVNQKDYENCGYHYCSLHHEVPTGLVILSRFPIEESVTMGFKASGNAPVLEGTGFPNYFNKGVLGVKIKYFDEDVWLFNTHLISCYAEFERFFWPERRLQIEELRNFIEERCNSTDQIILGGDFNCGPDSPDDGPGVKVINIPEDNYTYLTQTIFSNFNQGEFNSIQNSTCSTSNSKINREEGKVDHIFFSKQFDFIQGKVLFNEPVDIRPTNTIKKPLLDFLSDHYAWNVEISLKK